MPDTPTHWHRALILHRRRRFINHLLTYLLTYLLMKCEEEKRETDHKPLTTGRFSFGFSHDNVSIFLYNVINSSVTVAAASSYLTAGINRCVQYVWVSRCALMDQRCTVMPRLHGRLPDVYVYTSDDQWQHVSCSKAASDDDVLTKKMTNGPS